MRPRPGSSSVSSSDEKKQGIEKSSISSPSIDILIEDKTDRTPEIQYPKPPLGTIFLLRESPVLAVLAQPLH